MITMSDGAIAKAREIAAEEKLDYPRLRMRVEGGACAGLQYDLYFMDDEPSDMDEVFDCGGIMIAIDPLSFQYLDGTEVDYIEGQYQSGFKFLNPNTKGTCGCGSSFSA